VVACRITYRPFKLVLPEYAQLASHSLQATLERVDFAFQRFFKGLSRYPRFKRKAHYRGWTYPDRAARKAHTDGNNGRLELRDLGMSIPMRGQARTWGPPTTCTLFCDRGKWYASVTVACDPQRRTVQRSIGLDLGAKSAVATSGGWGASKYKAGEAGSIWLEAPTQSLKPTQRCAKCWHAEPKKLSERQLGAKKRQKRSAQHSG